MNSKRKFMVCWRGPYNINDMFQGRETDPHDKIMSGVNGSPILPHIDHVLPFFKSRLLSYNAHFLTIPPSCVHPMVEIKSSQWRNWHVWMDSISPMIVESPAMWLQIYKYPIEMAKKWIQIWKWPFLKLKMVVLLKHNRLFQKPIFKINKKQP